MRPALLLTLVVLFLVSCSNPYQEIEFVKITNLRVKNVTASNVDLIADCILYNPNAVAFELKQSDFKVYLYGRKAMSLLQARDAMLPANEQFTFPIEASVHPDQLYSNGRGLLDAAIQVLANKNVQVKYAGTVTVAKGDYSLRVPVIDSLKVPLKIKF